MFKKILFFALILVNSYVLYAAIGFFVMGYNCPAIIGNEKAVFMGNYILSIVFAVAFLAILAIIIWLGIKVFKKNKKDEK